MFEFLYRTSDIYVFLFMIAITTTFSILLITLNKIFIFYKFQYKDNTTTACIASLIGIIYGVLVGFMSLYLLNNQDHASNAALNESNAAANIYRESAWLKDPVKKQLQSHLLDYVKTVISVEWPEMTQGKDLDKNGGYLIGKMSSDLMIYPIVTPADSLIINQLVQDVNLLFKGRQERILMSSTQLSPDIWEVILISTVLIIVINYAFRVNFYLHLFTISAFAIMAASILFLLVTLDRPFQGEFIVEPDGLQSVLDLMTHKA